MTTPLSAACVDEILAAADEIGLPAGRVALAAADLRSALVRPLDSELTERHLRVLEVETMRLQRDGRNPASATACVARGRRVGRKGLVAAAILCAMLTTGGLSAAGLINATPRSIVESVANRLGLAFGTASGDEQHNVPGPDVTDPPRPGAASTSPAPSHSTPHASSDRGTEAKPAPTDTVQQSGDVNLNNANAGSPNAGNPDPASPIPGNPEAGNGNPNPGTGNPNPGNGNPGNGNPNPGNGNAGKGNPDPGNGNAGKAAK